MIAGGLAQLAAAKFQSIERFYASVMLLQGSNYFFLAAAILTVVLSVQGARMTMAIVAAGHVVAAFWGWRTLLADEESTGGTPRGIHWGEVLSLAGVTGAALLLPQIERLITPKILSLEELAQFGVIAAIVIGPFRVLQMGVGRTLTPRLREAKTPRARRLLMAKEGAVVGIVVLGALVFFWYLTNPLARWLAGPRYGFSDALLAATLFNGFVKVIAAFTRAAITALGTTPQLVAWNVVSWITVLLAAAGAVAGARWGLAGLVWGAAAGTTGGVLAGCVMLVPHLAGSGEEAES
jgi:hypothetical protein